MAGRYKAYPEYKDSDEEWLSTMPIHWEWSKVSWSFRAEKGKNGQLLTKEYCGRKKGEFPVYSGQTENGGVMGTIDTYEFDSGVKGVLFSTTVGAKAMHLTHLKGKFSLSQNCMIIMPMVSLDVRYCFYHFQPLFAHERSLIPDHMQASFRMEDLYQYKIILPPLIEQKQIARFLDHETGKIDALIEKQQALIALLQEKRQAVISHAVTKGLNPEARMKDSGVEWLGDVPEHWEVGSLRWYIGIASGEGLSNSEFDTVKDETHLHRVIGGNGTLGFTARLNTTEKALAIGRVGALCGNVHFINEDCWITDNALKLHTWCRFNDQFLFYTITAAHTTREKLRRIHQCKAIV